MTRILLLLVLCSVCQAPGPSDKIIEPYNLIDCTEENSAESGNWSVTKWLNKSKEYLFGKQRYVCCCPTQNKDTFDSITVRDVHSNDEQHPVCKTCHKVADVGENCAICMGCTCWILVSGVGKFFKDMFLGCLGYTISGCEKAWWKCSRSKKNQ